LAFGADERVAEDTFADETLIVAMKDSLTINDGRWRGVLSFSKQAPQRKSWKVAGGGYGIHWPDLDEDLSAEGLLRGAPATLPQKKS
jgi:Protein of unknown function (DUF2442)